MKRRKKMEKTVVEKVVKNEIELVKNEGFFKRHWRKLAIGAGVIVAGAAVVLGTKRSYKNGYEDGLNAYNPTVETESTTVE